MFSLLLYVIVGRLMVKKHLKVKYSRQNLQKIEGV